MPKQCKQDLHNYWKFDQCSNSEFKRN